METVLQIIGQFGFPIAACVCLFLLLQSEQKAHREESEKLTAAITDLKSTFNDSLHDQKESFTEALNNNTLVMQQLLDTLRKAE